LSEASAQALELPSSCKAVASNLGITKASLHYHYPGEAELGQALITRYAERFNQALGDVEGPFGGAGIFSVADSQSVFLP
jgi:AcrR family transcriptional regulator